MGNLWRDNTRTDNRAREGGKKMAMGGHGGGRTLGDSRRWTNVPWRRQHGELLLDVILNEESENEREL